MLDQAFDALKTFDWGADPKLLQAIDQAVVDTHDDNSQRAALEARLVAVLSDEISRDAKDYVCRKLRVIGTAKSVPALAALLPQEEYSHMARFALQQIPDPQAATAMRDALHGLNGRLKIGVIGSLGARRDSASVEPLAALLSDGDAPIAQAAALALGAICTPQAAAALANGRTNSAASSAVTDASLACAEGLLALGNKAEALAVYSKLAEFDQPKHIQLAAIRGKLMCAGKS